MEETPKCVECINQITLISLQCSEKTNLYSNNQLIATFQYKRHFPVKECQEQIKKAYENYLACLIK